MPNRFVDGKAFGHRTKAEPLWRCKDLINDKIKAERAVMLGNWMLDSPKWRSHFGRKTCWIWFSKHKRQTKFVLMQIHLSYLLMYLDRYHVVRSRIIRNATMTKINAGWMTRGIAESLGCFKKKQQSNILIALQQ